MKVCSKCGEQLENDAKFCVNCGSAAALAGGSLGGGSIPNQNPGSGKKIRIIIGALLAVILVASGIWGWKSFGTEAQVQSKLDLAVKYLSDNNYEQAVLAFNEVIKIDPKVVKAYQGLARTYTLQGNHDEAKATYAKGITAVAQDEKQTLQLGLAGMYIDQGQLDNAEKAFEDIKNDSQNCLEAYWGLAMVYQQKGDNTKAEAKLRQAIEQNPNEYRGYNTLALFLKQNHKADDAFDNIVKSLSLEINQQEAYLVLSDLYKGRWTELQRKLSSVSNQQVAAMLEFYGYYASEDAKVISSYQEILSTRTSNQKARILAAIAMVKNSDKTGAESLIKQVSAEKINDWLLSDMALYYQAAGDNETAKIWAIKAVKANPTNLDAIVLLQKLNTGDEKIYAAEYLLYNWKPVVKVNEELLAKSLPIIDNNIKTTNPIDTPNLATSPLETYTFKKSLKPGQYIAYDGPGTIGLPSHDQDTFLWFKSGSMTWDYPTDIPVNSKIQTVEYTAEISSEAPYANWNWPSNITASINGVEIGTWGIPGDPDAQHGFAKQKNHLVSSCSQYGWLTTWIVDGSGTYLEYKYRLGDQGKVKISNTTLNDIKVIPGKDMQIRLTVKNSATGGGLNIYGDTWGDYGQDPFIEVNYSKY